MSLFLALALVGPARAGLSCADATSLALRRPASPAAARLLAEACATAPPTPAGPGPLPPLPWSSRPEVLVWRARLLGPDRERYARWEVRGRRVRPVLERELRAAGLPTDLVYLAMLESGFEPRARSRAGAVGLWQLMPATARQYGLVVGPHRDDRTDPARATRAAAAFLVDLHAQFHDWPLAMAAYNCGPARVRRALAAAPGADFWELSRRGLLPPETRDYVPCILAAAQVARVTALARLKETLPGA